MINLAGLHVHRCQCPREGFAGKGCDFTIVQPPTSLDEKNRLLNSDEDRKCYRANYCPKCGWAIHSRGEIPHDNSKPISCATV